VTERGTRLSLPYVNERFAEIRAEAGLDPMLTPHCLRHSYVTHLAEVGVGGEVHPGPGRAQPRRDDRDLHVGWR
jgi:site-specific recombinase XerD